MASDADDAAASLARSLGMAWMADCAASAIFTLGDNGLASCRVLGEGELR